MNGTRVIRSLKAAVIGCTVLLGLPAVASAASGAGIDPRDQIGDNVDIKRVTVEHSAEQGTLDAEFELYTAFDNEYGTFSLALGHMDSRGSCVVPLRQEDGSYAGGQIGDAGLWYSVGFNTQPDAFYAEWGEISLKIIGVAGQREEFTLEPSRSADRLSLSYSIQSLGLVGRGYDCVGDIASRFTASYAVAFNGYGSEDQVASFCFDGPCPAAAEPVVTPPEPNGLAATQEAAATETAVTPPAAPPEAGGTAGIQQTSAVPSALSTSVAKSLVRGQLARQFGKRYTRRAERGYSLSCRKLSTRRATCRVAWRYRGARYSGSVAVTATSKGPRVTPRITVRRR